MVRPSQLGWQTNNVNQPNRSDYMQAPTSGGFGMGSLSPRSRPTATFQPPQQSLTATLAALARGGLSGLLGRPLTPSQPMTGGGNFWGMRYGTGGGTLSPNSVGVRPNSYPFPPAIQPGRPYS